MDKSLDIQGALTTLVNNISRASGNFEEWTHTGHDEWANPSWLIEICFLQLLSLVEALQMNELHRMILSEYYHHRNSTERFNAGMLDPDGDVYSVCLSRIRRYLNAVQQFFPKEDHTRVTKDLLDIVRDVHYVITDKALFGTAPSNENDVHIRIEGILKCVFPDLKHKPTLTKAIKNFEPDTGIPSIQTLIEYKFLGSSTCVPTMVDQILADTRGYVSRDWTRFLYVIYETNRFRPEKEWNYLLRQSGVSDNTNIVVLSGEPVAKHPKA